MSDLFETPAADAGAEVFSTRVVAATLGAMEVLALHLGRTPRLVPDAGRRGTAHVRRARRTAPARRSAMRANGSSSRRSPATSWSTTRQAGAATERRFHVAPGAVEVLTDPDSPAAHRSRSPGSTAAAGRRFDDFVDAYRHGGGVFLGAARGPTPGPRRPRSTARCSCTSWPRRSSPPCPSSTKAPAGCRPRGGHRQRGGLVDHRPGGRVPDVDVRGVRRRRAVGGGRRAGTPPTAGSTAASRSRPSTPPACARAAPERSTS